MAVIPKTMRIAAAKKPPISRNLRISFPPWCFDLLSKSQSRRPGGATSGRNRASDAGKPLLLCEEALLHRVPDELGTGGEVQLAHDVRAVRLGGAHRDVELPCDLLIRIPERE